MVSKTERIYGRTDSERSVCNGRTNGLMGTVTMPDKLKAVDIQILVTRAYQIADAMLIEKNKST